HAFRSAPARSHALASGAPRTLSFIWMKYLRSRLLESIPGIEHGFGTADEAIPSPFQADWDATRPQWKQVHGARSVKVSAPGENCGDTDALFSRTAGIPIAVQTADCVPVL